MTALTDEQGRHISKIISKTMDENGWRGNAQLENIIRSVAYTSVCAALSEPLLAKAVRDEAYEQCIKVADDYAKNAGNMYARRSGRSVADRIRALTNPGG